MGHSMGGTTIARATERYPHKIHVAVYVSGSMYTSGMSGTEINGEVYNLDYFFLALLLLEATICDKFYGMT